MNNSLNLETKIKNQIEFYLSDENLKYDAFFHKKIYHDKQGYLSLDLIRNCNIVKQSGYSLS